MIGEDDVFSICHGALWHVARDAIVSPFTGPCRVTAQALGPEPDGPLRLFRHGMRIVASAAPHTISRHPLATALRQVFDMARYLHSSAAARAHEDCHGLGQSVSRMARAPIGAGPHHTHLAEQMTLSADAIAPVGGKSGGIDNLGAVGRLTCPHFGNVQVAM